MNAKLSMAGYQLVVFYHLLRRARGYENDPQVQSLLEGPVRRMETSVEHAEENLFTEYNMEVSEILWTLIKKNFQTEAGAATLRGRIEQSMAEIFAAEIEKQLAAQIKIPDAESAGAEKIPTGLS